MLRTLHSLRFVFVMLIVLSHLIGHGFDFGGECGVAFFFILSGFVLSLAYGNSISENRFSTRALVGKQLLKFYPFHLITMAVVLTLDARLGLYPEWEKILPSIFLIQSWVPSEQVYFFANGPAWFLADIVFLYLIFRCLFAVLNKLTVRQAIIASAVVVIVYLLLGGLIPEERVNYLLYVFPPTRVIDFAIGILLYRAYQSRHTERIRTWLSECSPAKATALELTIVVLIVLTALVYPHTEPHIRCASIFWVVVPVTVFFFATIDKSGGLVTRLLTSKPMMSLGSISFEIYMIHAIVKRIVQSIAMNVGIESDLCMAVVIILTTIALAYPVKIFFVDKIYRKASNFRYIDKNAEK